MLVHVKLFNLQVFDTVVGEKGFKVYMSIPYGPVNEVMAYLGRAAENRAVITRTEKERLLLILVRVKEKDEPLVMTIPV